MLNKVTKFQIGKNGVTEGAIGALNNLLKNSRQVRISILKSANRDREKIREMVKILDKRLDIPCDYKIIGFTIILRRRISRK